MKLVVEVVANLILVIGAIALLLVGCAASGPVQAGRDTYMVANTGAWSWSSGAALKGDLFQQANAFCQSRGLEVQPINTASNNGSFSQFAHAELQFRCLASDDPELARPRVRKVPDVVIETDRIEAVSLVPVTGRTDDEPLPREAVRSRRVAHGLVSA
jgi:hypothetical protein